jgi:hypothetical protein
MLLVRRRQEMQNFHKETTWNIQNGGGRIILKLILGKLVVNARSEWNCFESQTLVLVVLNFYIL